MLEASNASNSVFEDICRSEDMHWPGYYSNPLRVVAEACLTGRSDCAYMPYESVSRRCHRLTRSSSNFLRLSKSRALSAPKHDIAQNCTLQYGIFNANFNKGKSMSKMRTADYPIDVQFLDRWSPRAFSDRVLTDEQVMTVLEAARWAPSASNLQPWRFFVGLRGEPQFDTLLQLLVPFNQAWAKNAGALVFITSVRTFDGERPNRTHSFDAGSAFMSLTLQAHSMGLVAHGMAGIDYERVPAVLGLPTTLHVEAAVAIGYQGDAATLPEVLQQREVASQRQPLADVVYKGAFTGAIKAPS